jgi:hypothetical protein
MSYPQQCGMPSLEFNVQGLRAHSVLVGIFSGQRQVSEAEWKWGSWLVHCLTKAAIHYNQARDLMLAEPTRVGSDGRSGASLHMFDFSFAMEDCITSVDKAVEGIKVLSDRGFFEQSFAAPLRHEAEAIRAFRNKQEHMQGHLPRENVGRGPVLVMVDVEGLNIKLLDLSMPLASVHELIGAVFLDVASLFPGFDVASPATPIRPLVMTVSANATVTHANAVSAQVAPSAEAGGAGS